MERRIFDNPVSPVPENVGAALTARATVDEFGTVTGWSEGAERLLGYASTQILGRPAGSLLAEEPRAGELPPFSELPRWHGTLALRHRDGHRIEARGLAHHRTSDDGTRDWLLVSAVKGSRPHPDDDALGRQGPARRPSAGWRAGA